MKKLDTRELWAFFAIYIVWGSTYLAIREAVATIPPLLTAGVRHFVAALVLYAIVAMRGSRTRVTAAEWRNSLVPAVLFFLIGHGTLHWAERTVPSGIAALFFATEPVWIAILMPAGAGAGVTLRTIGGLLLGLVGVALLGPLESFDAASSGVWGSLAIRGGAMTCA